MASIFYLQWQKSH